jgi:ribosomal protein S16
MKKKFLVTSMDVNKLLTWINQGGQRTSYIRVFLSKTL